MIQLTNDYEAQVYNGDIGHVVRVWSEGKTIRFAVAFTVRCASGGTSIGTSPVDEGRSDLLVHYTRSALGRDIALSYALTVHKAQGSEYPVVVLALLPQHASMLQRNILYTGISRARQLLVLVGSTDAVRKAVKSDESARRNTLLAERVDDRRFAPPATRHMLPE